MTSIFGNTLDNKDCYAAISLETDRSSSLSANEWQKQLNGTADAITSDDLMFIIGIYGPIAVRAGAFNENIDELIGWRLIKDEQSAQAFAEELRSKASMGVSGVTHTAQAIMNSVAELESPERIAICPEPKRQTIDISTDGQPRYQGSTSEKAWEDTAIARDVAEANGIVINVLPVGFDQHSIVTKISDNMLTTGGKIFESTWDEYADVMRRKLVSDVAGLEGLQLLDQAYDESGPSMTPANDDTRSIQVANR